MKLPPPSESSHPVDVGLRTEAHITGELVRRGYTVLLPFGVNQRYDLVLDDGGRFVRVQCKTGRLRHGVVLFSGISVRCNTREILTRGYEGEVELFLISCPDNDRIYAVPIEEVTGGCGSLRVAPTRNGQRRRVRWARDYELPG
ncbi:MAG: hypothetical protein FJW90_08285 [Actinobacteria bacterium]|nr:hypothetical protein [Actinomycetota bacterium]